jgi:hypothetical protein
MIITIRNYFRFSPTMTNIGKSICHSPFSSLWEFVSFTNEGFSVDTLSVKLRS